MSTIVRMPNGKIKLYTKGADTVIYERLAQVGSSLADSTLVHLEVSRIATSDRLGRIYAYFSLVTGLCD